MAAEGSISSTSPTSSPPTSLQHTSSFSSTSPSHQPTPSRWWKGAGGPRQCQLSPALPPPALPSPNHSPPPRSSLTLSPAVPMASLLCSASLRNLLLGLRSSSWSSQSQLSSSLNPSTSPSSPSSAAAPPSPPVGGLIPSLPVTVAPTNLSHPVSSDEVNIGGGKTITYFGSIALLVNSVTGAGMVLFAQLYQQAGWLLTTFCLLLLMLICAMGALMLVECMAMMPRNGQFRRRVEYTTVMKYYCTHRWYVLISMFYQLSLAITNISLIVQSMQVMVRRALTTERPLSTPLAPTSPHPPHVLSVSLLSRVSILQDFTIVAIAGRTCTIPEFHPNVGFRCPEPISGQISPFDPSVYCIPLGLFFTALIVIPLGLLDLDANVIVQKGAFISLITILLIWLGLMSSQSPVAERVPTIGTSLAGVLGTSLFNFAIVTSVPSWINERKEGVSIVSVILTVLGIAVAIFIILGWLGGAAFEPWSNSATLLDKLKDVGVLGQVSFYAFPLIVFLNDIPVLAIMQRYNLLNEKVCGKKMANFLAVVLPWLIAIPLYAGNGYQQLANWGGVLVTSAVNFIIPIVVYIVAVRKSEGEAKANAEATQASATTGDMDSSSLPAVIAESVTVEEMSASNSVEEAAVEGKEAATAGALNQPHRQRLSISGTVAWLKAAASSSVKGRTDMESPSGLQPAPMPHFSFSTASTKGEEAAGVPHSPATPALFPALSTPSSPASAVSASVSADEEKLCSSSPKLEGPALRWAAEEDHLRAAAAAGAVVPRFPRDLAQPTSGSLRLTRGSTPGSRQNLLADLTSSFTSRSLHPSADAEDWR